MLENETNPNKRNKRNDITTKHLLVYSSLLTASSILSIPLQQILIRNKGFALPGHLELLEMETKELKSVDPGIIEERFKSIEETLYSTKEILSMKDVCHYLDISQSMLYKLTCNGEIPHFKPRGKTIFFEKKELIKWIKKKGRKDSGKNRKNSKSST